MMLLQILALVEAIADHYLDPGGGAILNFEDTEISEMKEGYPKAVR